MHILYIHQYFCPPGGAGNNRSLDLARTWVAAGHRVTMLTSTAYFPDDRYDKGKLHSFDCEGIEVVALPVDYSHMMPFRARIRAWLRFYRQAQAQALRGSKPDLIYASSTPLTVGELGRKLALRWGIPFVFECVDVWPDVPIGMGIVRNGWLKRWLNSRTDRIYAAAAAIVALSDGMRAQILRHGVPPAKVVVAYNGTDLAAFPFVERPARRPVQVIYTGTVGLANGVDVLVHLCKRLEALGRTDITFTVLGAGNDRSRVQALAHALEAPQLKFLAAVPKEAVHTHLAAADIGIVTFAPYLVLEANSANKFYDYLSSGLPVVINYEGWQADYIKAHNCGLSSPMGDLEALAQNIIRLADDAALRTEMGQNGRALAEETFDRKQIAVELLDLFERTLGK